ncbi:MAG: hypothetical protein JNK29_00780, partial [Anaerolineales bacterium]|nr:hypothetical protein [Anaerolineales bacterium]
DNSYNSDIPFSPDPQARYFSVYYDKSGVAELRRTETGAVVALDGTPTGVAFGNGSSSQYALVMYAGAPAALYRLDEASPVRLATLNGAAGGFGPLNFSPDPEAAYFTVTYDTARAELWTTRGDEPHRLAPLGLAAFNQWFDLAGQRVVVWFYDERLFLLDLQLLDRLDGRSAELSAQDLLTLGCDTLARHAFDEAQLRDYLGGAAPLACQ